MSAYNEQQAVENHTAAHHQISKLVAVIERRDKRISDQERMIEWLRKRNAILEAENSPLGQAEKVFTNGE